MPPAFLTLRDLKTRGWSATMIRTLLGPHDAERLTNRLGYSMVRPARLYDEARVLQLETSEAFAEAQGRAQAHQRVMQRAAQTRQVWQAEAVAQYEAVPLPEVQVKVSPGEPLTPQHLWIHHLQAFYVWKEQHERLLSGVPQTARLPAERRVFGRYREAVARAYGWPSTWPSMGSPSKP